jgi:hypothetical protein
MTKEEFIALVKEYSNRNIVMSFHQEKDPAYIKMLDAGKEVIPWALERLKDSIGNDRESDMDHGNSPWLTIHLIGQITNKECYKSFPKKHAGKLDMLRKYVLKWGKAEGYIA